MLSSSIYQQQDCTTNALLAYMSQMHSNCYKKHIFKSFGNTSGKPASVEKQKPIPTSRGGEKTEDLNRMEVSMTIIGCVSRSETSIQLWKERPPQKTFMQNLTLIMSFNMKCPLWQPDRDRWQTSRSCVREDRDLLRSGMDHCFISLVSSCMKA